MFLTTFFSQILQACLSNRKRVLSLFYMMYAAFFLVVPLLSYILVTQPDAYVWITFLGKSAGQLSVLLFFAATYPGILGRFRMRHPLITLGMSFRRHIGISSFLLGLGHALLVYIVPALQTGTFFRALTAYVLFGMVALFIFFLLFVTSNDVSVKLLGPKWKLLHKSVYIAYWIIFLHVMFQKVGIFAYLIGISATLEMMSLLYDFLKKREITVSS